MTEADARSFPERFAKNEAFRQDVMGELTTGAETTPQQPVELGGGHLVHSLSGFISTTL